LIITPWNIERSSVVILVQSPLGIGNGREDCYFIGSKLVGEPNEDKLFQVLFVSNYYEFCMIIEFTSLRLV